MGSFKREPMKELNTKPGVFLTAYSKEEIDMVIEEYLERNDSDGGVMFMDEIRSFNPNSPHYLKEKEAKKWVGLEVKKGKKNPHNLYTNYKGAPLGLSISNVTFYFTDPISSLKSAFEVAVPDFDFDKDFFHFRIVK